MHDQVVAVFVMPCVGCIWPAVDAQTVAESYATTYPGQVEMYLVDDDGMDACTTLNTWRNSNGLHIMPTFTTTAFVQTQYGTPGMPKIVVMGGAGHHIYYNENNAVDTAALADAIDLALGISTAIKEVSNVGRFEIFPNPASSKVNITYSGHTDCAIKAELADSKGAIIKAIAVNARLGDNEISFDISDVATGVYFMRIVDGEGTFSKQFIVK